MTIREDKGIQIRVSFESDVRKTPLDGRLLVMFSTDPKDEPRFQINDSPKTQQIFGIDVNDLQPDQEVVVDSSALGLPAREPASPSRRAIPRSGFVHLYETFHRSDGHTRQASHGPRRRPAVEQGPRQPLQHAAGSDDRAGLKSGRADQHPARQGDSRRSPSRRPPSTSSTSASRATCSPSSGAGPCTWEPTCSCPKALTPIPNARYPLVIFHGHFPQTFGGFREQPPDENLKPDYNERFHLAGYNRIVQDHAHRFYKEWTGPNYPRMVIIEIQHANPYYDDSYAVNSANLGPYGDAITYELIPYLEKKYRCLGAGWARFLYGGSTGGWEALAAQIFYPKEFNGCYAACPDPIDFRAYTVVDIYKDKNAYRDEGPVSFRQAARRTQLPRAHLLDSRRHQPARARPGHQEPLGPAMGYLGGRLFSGRARRLSQADLGQAHRRDRPRGGAVLERALRPARDPRARLAQDRQGPRRQDQHLRGRYGQFLPQ